jgi:hypothetical protein
MIQKFIKFVSGTFEMLETHIQMNTEHVGGSMSPCGTNLHARPTNSGHSLDAFLASFNRRCLCSSLAPLRSTDIFGKQLHWVSSVCIAKLQKVQDSLCSLNKEQITPIKTTSSLDFGLYVLVLW